MDVLHYYMASILATDNLSGKQDRTCILSTCTASIINDPLIENDSLLFKGEIQWEQQQVARAMKIDFCRDENDNIREKSIHF